MRGDRLYLGPGVEFSADEAPDWVRVYCLSPWTVLFLPRSPTRFDVTSVSESLLTLEGGSTGKFGSSVAPPPGGSVVEGEPIQLEDPTMPQGVRRWCERYAKRYVKSKRGASEGWQTNTLTLLCQLVRWGRRGRSRVRDVPPIFTRAGVAVPPLTPEEVTPEQVQLLHDFVADHYSPTTGPAVLSETRRFLRWAENPVAEDDTLWQLPEGDPVTVRWTTVDEYAKMMSKATSRECAVLTLGFLCGLRSVEVDRLLVRNVRSEGPEPSLLVLGKGRAGGKWRALPYEPLAREYVDPFVVGKPPDAKVIPRSLETIQKDARNAGRRVGLGCSTHDLRRGFGRAYFAENEESWKALLSLQRWYGHARPETTVRYLGIRFEEMRAGIRPLEARVRAALQANSVDRPASATGEVS